MNPESSDEPSDTAGDRRYDRRKLLVRTGRTAAAAGAFGALLSGWPAGALAGPRARTLRLHHDAAVGPIFAPFVADFNKRYKPLKLATSYVTQDYLGVTQAQLAGGSVDYDVLFADEGFLEKWHRNGWVRNIDDLPGVKALLGLMRPSLAKSLYAADGSLVALPYFYGTEIFVYNADYLGKINAGPPKTWNELVETSRELKSKKVVDTPYSPFWGKAFFLIWHEIHAEAASDGAGPFFDAKFKPLFTTDPVVERTLKRWKLLFDQGLIPKDTFTSDYGGTANVFAGGKSAFTLRYQAQLAGWKNPQQSTVADAVKNALIPGSKHTSHTFGAHWYIAKSAPDPKSAALLLTYLAGKDKNGVFYVPKNLIAITFGLMTPYDAVNVRDPDVTKAWSKFADVKLLRKQLANSVTLGPVVNQPWYPQLTEMASGLLQEAVLGSKTVKQVLKEIRDFVNTQRAKS